MAAAQKRTFQYGHAGVNWGFSCLLVQYLGVGFWTIGSSLFYGNSGHSDAHQSGALDGSKDQCQGIHYLEILDGTRTSTSEKANFQRWF